MRTNILKYMGIFSACVALLYACTPDDESFFDNSVVDMKAINRVKLRANHYMLLADGKARLEFYPELHHDSGYIVPDYRVDRGELEYYSVTGKQLSADYTTSDASLIGQKLEVYAKVKATGCLSDTISFQVISPTLSTLCRERTVPVIFHIVQTREEVTSYGGNFTLARVENILEKMNNTFSGNATTNPTGVDTKIRFKLALYNPDGRKLSEPGINRVTVESIDASGKYASFIQTQNMMWPYDKYLNVWVISSPETGDGEFGPNITSRCIPCYVNDAGGESPRGLSFTKVSPAWNPVPEEIGIIFKLQIFNKQSWRFSNWAENEFVHYLGSYFGLLRTSTSSDSEGPEDYCSDTFGYGDDDYAYKNNGTRFKSVGPYFFLSENIMDDPTGMHRSVSREQCERVHWVMENCPERSAWKNGFALTGK